MLIASWIETYENKWKRTHESIFDNLEGISTVIKTLEKVLPDTTIKLTFFDQLPY